MAGVSLKCGDCGTLLRSVEEAQEHAELNSHSNFSESTEAVLNLVCSSCGKPCRSKTKKKKNMLKFGAGVAPSHHPAAAPAIVHCCACSDSLPNNLITGTVIRRIHHHLAPFLNVLKNPDLEFSSCASIQKPIFEYVAQPIQFAAAVPSALEPLSCCCLFAQKRKKYEKKKKEKEEGRKKGKRRKEKKYGCCVLRFWGPRDAAIGLVSVACCCLLGFYNDRSSAWTDDHSSGVVYLVINWIFNQNLLASVFAWIVRLLA